jgi:lipopolysaccharide/colanic/teichoic acid biosynthesis glycosyltransferase
MQMLCIERNRAERAGRRLVLMVLESVDLTQSSGVLKGIQQALARASRDTDIKGWYGERSALAVIFTEIPITEASIIPILQLRIRQVLTETLTESEAAKISLDFHAFPEDHFSKDAGDESDSGRFATIYPDLASSIRSKRVPLVVKRFLDIVGSLVALVVLSPLMLLIAAAVKLTSQGPVLFRQTRIGQGGEEFTFLKFRSMCAKADSAIHEAFVQKLIANGSAAEYQGDGAPVFKLQSDPRITPLGAFLRRTSLDETPQFFCVLSGYMSLVGPRPSLPYEVAVYKPWHRRRFLAIKPGITGYWQVEGRSRVNFDEMVRMDIRYARTWSLWSDVKILWRTPKAVLNGNGAC